MRFRKHIIYGIVFLLLTGYYVYFEVIRQAKQEQQEEAAKKVFDFEVSDVSRVVLSRKDAPEIVVVRKEGAWMLRAPVQDKADDMEVEELLDHLRVLSRTRNIGEEKREELSSFGLDPPVLRIRFKTSKGWHELRIGEKSPVGSDVYAMVAGREEIFMIGSGDRSILDKRLFALREKRLFSFGTDEVEECVLENGPFHITLVHNKGGWRIPGKKGVRLSKKKVESLIRDFCWARIRRFVRENDENLDKYGLQQPKVAVTLAKGKERKTLWLGKRTPSKEEVYARLEGRKGVVALEGRLLEGLPDSLAQLEDRRVLPVEHDAVDEISWERGGRRFTLTRSEKEDVWNLSSPHMKTPSKVDGWKVDTLLFRIDDLEWKHREAAAPEVLKTAKVRIILRNKAKKELGKVFVGELSSKTKTAAVGVERNGAVTAYQVPLEAVRHLIAKIDEMEPGGS